MDGSDLIWVDKQGNEHRIGDMSSRHLSNTIRMLKTKVIPPLKEEEDAGFSISVFVSGEEASRFVENELMDIAERLGDYEFIVECMEKELKSRGDL